MGERQLVSEKKLKSMTFRAMNTTIEVALRAHQAQFFELERYVVNWFNYVEQRFSRFRESSELSKLNQQAGHTVLVSNTMLEVLQLVQRYERMTEGIFNPLIGGDLIRAGYHRSFEQLTDETVAPLNEQQRTPGRGQLLVHPSMKSARWPSGTLLDLGGIVKGWAVERLVQFLQRQFAITDGMVNAGGDLKIWGFPDEQRRSWAIRVEHPFEPATHVGHLVFAHGHGAVATSSTLGRAWKTAHGTAHHLIDPGTGKPSESNVVQCTVVGPNPSVAEVWSKVICIAGMERAVPLMKTYCAKGEHYEAIIFTADGQRHLVDCASAYSLVSQWLLKEMI